MSLPIVLQPSRKSELHHDTLLEVPNRIGISLIGYLPSKLAHLLLYLSAVNQGRLTCSDLSDSFPDNSHGAGVRFIEPLAKCGAFFWCQLSIASWISAKLVISEHLRRSFDIFSQLSRCLKA
jgi:hypothetical protein